MNEIKFIVIALLLAIIASLGKALFHMSTNTGQSGQMVKALTVRIALSVALFVVLFISWHFGLIAPHDVTP